MRKLFLFLSLTLLVLASAFVVLPAPAMAAPPECHIVNQTTDIKYDNLQTAVDAATAGDTLKLKGTCVGDTTILKNLTIQGQSNPAFGTATIQGTGNFRSALRIVDGPTVNLNGLTITGGNTFLGGGIFAFEANLTLNDSVITGNHALGVGGAIFHSLGTLTLNNTTVTGNSAVDGAGIIATCGSVPTLNNSTVSNNISTRNGGGFFLQCGVVLTLNGSTVSNNSANVGGGLYIAAGSVVLDATSSISGNMPDDCAGVNCP